MKPTAIDAFLVEQTPEGFTVEITTSRLGAFAFPEVELSELLTFSFFLLSLIVPFAACHFNGEGPWLPLAQAGLLVLVPALTCVNLWFILT